MIKISFESIDTSMCQILGEKINFDNTLGFTICQSLHGKTLQDSHFHLPPFEQWSLKMCLCTLLTLRCYTFKTSSSVHVYTNQDAAILLCSRHNKVTRFQISDNNYWKNETGRWSSVVVDFGLPLRQFLLYVYLTVTCRF